MRTIIGIIRLSLLFLAILVLSLLFQTTQASAVFIDFETYPGGSATSHFDQVDTDYSSWGISEISSLAFNPSTGGFDIVPAIIRQDVLTHPYPSGISALAPWPGDTTVSNFPYGPAQAPIQLTFTNPLNYFSVYAVDVGYNGLIVQAYDSNSSLLSAITIDGTGRLHNGIQGGNGLDFIEFTDYGISSIRFSQVHDASWDRTNKLGTEGYLVDSMTFTVAPEPVSSVLFIAGGSLLAFRRFRK